jgi:hypothetical protein
VTLTAERVQQLYESGRCKVKHGVSDNPPSDTEVALSVDKILLGRMEARHGKVTP